DLPPEMTAHANLWLPLLLATGLGCLVYGGWVLATAGRRFGWSLAAPGSFAGVVLDALPEGAALIAPNGRVRLANPTLASLVGRPGDALTGLQAADLLPGLSLAHDTGLRDHECELERSCGERIPVSVSCSPLRDRRGASL